MQSRYVQSKFSFYSFTISGPTFRYRMMCGIIFGLFHFLVFTVFKSEGERTCGVSPGRELFGWIAFDALTPRVSMASSAEL